MMMPLKITGVLAVGLLATGCATKKYVAKTIAPVESRVGGTESKNSEQDKMIAEHGTQIGEMDKDLSRTKERLSDTDAKAVAAGESARRAGEKADGAQLAADGARTLAQQGIQKTDDLAKAVDGMNRYQVAKSDTILFPVGKSTLTTDAKAQIDEFYGSVADRQRYVIEVQGFTDKTGTPALNEALSEARAQEVARYLANEHKVPLRSISMLGSGYAQPVADDKTRDGRKQNRRVELRLFVPETATASNRSTEVVATQASQNQ